MPKPPSTGAETGLVLGHREMLQDWTTRADDPWNPLLLGKPTAPLANINVHELNDLLSSPSANQKVKL